MKVAVVGRGLMGSAAARHLTRAGQDVTLIGPSEPVNKRTHRGVFGSHYDEGRITRKNAHDPFWVEVSKASIARYAEIERTSGIRFFAETGALMAGGADWMARIDAAARAGGVESAQLDASELRDQFPFFRFPTGFTGAYEAKSAGHISPRRLVAAQTKAAEMAGARVWDVSVDAVSETADQVKIITPDGEARFDHVLVAAGGWTDHLLRRAPQLDVYQRTVALFEISQAQTARLATMPSLVYEAPEAPYLLPPIRYPDGRTYIKLGGDPADIRLPDLQAIHDWFRGGGSGEVRDQLEQMIRALMPDLEIKRVIMDACVTSWTKNRLPEISRLSERVSVCTGGNGAGAKCSDELGRRGAALICERIGEIA